MRHGPRAGADQVHSQKERGALGLSLRGMASALVGGKEKILQKGRPVSVQGRLVQGRPATAVPTVVLITALRYVLTDWLETAGYLQQRGRMHELGSSFERRVAEWPSDD